MLIGIDIVNYAEMNVKLKDDTAGRPDKVGLCVGKRSSATLGHLGPDLNKVCDNEASQSLNDLRDLLPPPKWARG